MKRLFLTAVCGLFLAPASFAIVDTNNNGVSDFWERAQNNGELFPATFDPQADSDSDGWTNAQEAAAGTDPFDPNPPDGLIRPEITHIPAVLGGPDENGIPVLGSPEAVTVTWPTLVGKQYTLLFSPDLSEGSWIPVGDPFIAYGGVCKYDFYEVSAADKCFWRVSVGDVDSDSDGLTNHEEFELGTSSSDSDSDGDGLPDAQEVTLGTAPNNSDTDSDGVSDAEEVASGHDPKSNQSFPPRWVCTSRYGTGAATPPYVWADWDSSLLQRFESGNVTAASLAGHLATLVFPGSVPETSTLPDGYAAYLGTAGGYRSGVWYGALSQVRCWLQAKPAVSTETKRTVLRITTSSRQPYGQEKETLPPVIEELEVVIPANATQSEPIDLLPTFGGLPELDEEQQITTRLVPVEVRQRIPVIPDDGGETTYHYRTVTSVPRDQPTPGVEITRKSIVGNQVTISAKIYDVLSDVTEGAVGQTPKLWVNSRLVPPVAGDKNGVYRLDDYSCLLYPGRNEINVAVENSLGSWANHKLVIEGDELQGYEFAGQSVRVPEQPTYPVVYEIIGVDAQENQMLTLNLGGKSVNLGHEQNAALPGPQRFRSKPFISVNLPATASPEQVDELPVDKPVFLAGLQEDLNVEIPLPDLEDPYELSSPQGGIELTSPATIEILETGERNLSLQFSARGIGSSPMVNATLETFQGDRALQNVAATFQSAYQAAFYNLEEEAKEDLFSFSVTGLTAKDGYNSLDFAFVGNETPEFTGNYHTFRFDSPSKSGVRVYSADWKRNVVLDGVTARPQDIWYPVASDADLSGFSEALAASGCRVVGMTDVNGGFDDAPLKRSFLVRGPPGHSFQAFDKLYAAQGRPQRSQTFGADGTNGVALAGELNRVQTDDDLPASARNALGLEIASTYQFHNGFEDYVPKTHQPYVDPGTGIPQPNSWTMRGSSLPDHPQSNPTPWTVTSTLSDPARAASVSGIVKLDTTAENTTYYATTSATAPWNLTGARAVSLRFKLLTHDATNGADGAFQLAAGDGSRTWTCQVAPSQVKIQGTAITLPVAKFPGGLIDGRFHTLQFNLSGTGNDAVVSIDGEVLTATATAQSGSLNGIAFGDPGAGVAGKLEVETLAFENSELMYQYGVYDSDAYADSDEIDGANNILLYLRSKGQAFRTSAVARWVRVLDPKVHEWLLEKYTGKSDDGSEQELHILANSDVWLGSIVDMDVSTDYGSVFNLWDSKVTNTLVLDSEETKIWSTDRTREDMELAGILMGWVYQQHEYKVWLAILEGRDADAILIEKKHLVENIVKCAKRVETTLEVGGEIAISMTYEIADYAITIKDLSQGEYMAMVGFIPLVPSSTARAFKFLNKADGATIEAIHQLSKKLGDFPSGRPEFPNVNLPGNKRVLDFNKIFANADDAEAVARARNLTANELIPNSGYSGHRLLDTFSNSNVSVFNTKQPVKAYRCFSSNPNISEFGPSGGFLMFEKPVHRTQVEVDYALGKKTEGFFLKNPDGSSAYDRYVEVEIPEGVYVYMGYAADQGGNFKGGGTQFWIDDAVRDGINWNVPWNELPQY